MTNPQSADPLLLLHEDDNVLVLRAPASAGQTLAIAGAKVRIGLDLSVGHKIARRTIEKGASIYKYGAPIGHAVCNIQAGEHVHLHNLASSYTKIEDMNA